MQAGAEAFIIHYTYGQDLSEAGAFTPGVRGFWHWDKREYERTYPPRNISLPVKCQVNHSNPVYRPKQDAQPSPKPHIGIKLDPDTAILTNPFTSLP